MNLTDLPVMMAIEHPTCQPTSAVYTDIRFRAGAAVTLVSRYIRETSLVDAKADLILADSSSVRLMSQCEADGIAGDIQKRNVFARHSWENSFYVKRARGFADKTIIEVHRPGQPAHMAGEAERVSDLIETLLMLSCVLAMRRKEFLRKLGIAPRPRSECDLIMSPDLQYVRSRTRLAPESSGLPIDRTAVARFHRLGFERLFQACEAEGGLSSRLRRSAAWLLASRCEPNAEAALVKNTIALESLLVLSQGEPVTRLLSERGAFLLSPSPDTRHRVANALRGLYDARSRVVHGNRRPKRSTASLLEAGDRMAVLLLLVVAANAHLWPDEGRFRSWLDDERWRGPTKVHLLFGPIYLSRAIGFAENP
jgi:hypothetical protein